MKFCNKIISFVLLLTIISGVLVTAPFSAVAASIEPDSTIQLTATCNYDDAFDILEKLNKMRTMMGLEELSMDPQMMEDAMQRAAELMLYTSHARPDGSSCFTVNENAFAENLAMGYGSTDSVMNAWADSEMHYANMMSEDFNTVGIGAVVHNGVPCWIQLFGIKSYEGETNIPENTTKVFDINVGDNEYELFIDSPQSIYEGDSAQLQIKGQTRDNICYYTLNSDSFVFSSSDETVISVDKNKVVAAGAGKATITATSAFATISTTIEVLQFSSGNSRQCGDNIFWEYKEGTLTLNGTGEMYDYSTYCNENDEIVTDAPYTDGFEKVKKVVVNEGITGIGQCAFAWFEKLETVELPTTLTKLGDFAFAECHRLKTVSMHEGIKEIPFGCFDTCYSLESIDIPQSVETIGQNAFLYCTSLKQIQLPDNLQHLVCGAFFCCSSLREITIPATTKEIESGTFNQCMSLSKVTILNPNIKFGVPDMFSSIAKTLTVYGYNNSTAQRHCMNNNINFVSLGDAPTIPGDANLDTKVDILDATLIQQHIAHIISLDDIALSAADANADGEVNILDATHIQKFVAHIIPSI